MKNRTIRRTLALAAVALAGAGTAAATAPDAHAQVSAGFETIGSTLQPADDPFVVPCKPEDGVCTVGQVSLGGTDLTADQAGVVTRLRYTGRWYGKYTIFGVGDDVSYWDNALVPGQSANVTLTSNGPHIVTTNTRVPIRAGQRIAVRTSGTDYHGYSVAWRAGAKIARYTNGSILYTTPDETELLIQAQVEPDADRDGYGDTTQDLCPSSALSQAKYCVA